jgi:hypothetical protein
VSDYILSANMNLPIPETGIEPGPFYANDVNNSLSIIDGHTHAFGSGVLITPQALNINTDLTIQGNNLTNLRSVRFSPQLSPLSGIADIGCVYESGVDLWYNDGLGNQVRITASGGVAGSPGSISGLVSPASASYNSGSSTFVWQSNVNTAANMDAGSYILRNLTANSDGLTLSPPTLSSSYTITLPQLPTSTSIMVMDVSGNIGFGPPSAVSADQVGTAMDSVGANAVANSRTRAVASTVGIGGIALSPSCGVFTSSSSAYVQITNFSVTITTSGRPVMITIVGDGSGSTNESYFTTTNSLGANSKGVVLFDNNAVAIAQYPFQLFANTGGVNTMLMPTSFCSFIDFTVSGVPGTYTYTAYMKVEFGTAVAANYASLCVYEL